MFTKGAQVVFAFSDAAGAHACMAQAFILQQENQCNIVCISNKPMTSSHWKIPVRVQQAITETDLHGADVLFTGTSHPTTSHYFELHAIRLAKTKKIHTISFVDHWTSIRMRFELETEMVLPDEIWVTDERAKAAAIMENIPQSLIHVKKNPYLVFLSSYWKTAFPEKSYAEQLGLNSTKKIIVIAPDPVSLRTQDFDPGFTEVSALDDLLQKLSEIQSHVTLIIKAHPLQPMDTLRTVLDRYPKLDLKLITQANYPELINLADAVIGFYSNFLLEALAMNKPVVRYFPGNLKLDPFGHLPQIPPISNPQQALLSLQAIL